MILAQYAEKEIFTTYVLVILTGIAFILAGAILIVKKDTELVGKRLYFSNPKLFCLIYGLIEVCFGGGAVIAAIVGMFNLGNVFIMFGAGLLLVILLVGILVFKIVMKYKMKK